MRPASGDISNLEHDCNKLPLGQEQVVTRRAMKLNKSKGPGVYIPPSIILCLMFLLKCCSRMQKIHSYY
jgi:hypothetical protein